MPGVLNLIASGSGESIERPPCGRLLTAAEVASRLRVPVSWVRKNGGHLPGLVRLGKYVRWDEKRLDELIAAGGRS